MTDEKWVKLESAAASLKEHLGKTIGSGNVQAIGIGKNRLVVYTFKKPSREEKEITRYLDCKIEWMKIGRIVIGPG